MEEEFELTYLVKTLPANLLEYPHKEVHDIYIPESLEHPVLRLRKTGDVRTMTKKEPVSEDDSSHQTEHSIQLTEAEFAALASVPGKHVRKIRYYYEEQGVTIEVDVFQDALEGLVLADVEFDSAEEKDAFATPAWMLADVTQEKFVAGGMLCGKTYADIASQLERFNYIKITL